jgi:hypothetical protein
MAFVEGNNECFGTGTFEVAGGTQLHCRGFWRFIQDPVPTLEGALHCATATLLASKPADSSHLIHRLRYDYKSG